VIVTTEATATETTATDSAPSSAAPETATSTDAGGGSQEAAPVSTEPQTYTPNFKFKVHDKEHEIEDYLRGVVKDPDTEKKLRELHERAYGLEHVKNDRTKLREQNQQVLQENTQLKTAYGELGGLLAKKDFASFFEKTNVSEDDVLRWAIQVAERRQNPQAQAAYQQERQAQQQFQQLQAQNQNLQAGYEQMAMQAREFELSQVLGRPDVQQTAQAFEARVGRPGAFKEEVAKRGFLHWQMTGKDITAEQAVNEVLQILGGTTPQQQNLGQPAAPQVQPGTQAKAPEGKPVIPNIQGRGTSPVAKVPTSVNDLRALARQKGA
jgi:hypothetical protein